MTDDLLKQLQGEAVSHFSLVKYLSLGIETVIIHLSSGYAVELHAREIKLGRDEAYTIEAQQSQGQEGIERVEAGWRVGSVRIVKRQDWIELGGDRADLIGDNPRVHTWGVVGTAPGTAAHLCIVDFGVVLVSEGRDRQAMIYLANYPGLVCFTTNALEITSLCDSYQSVGPSANCRPPPI